MQPFRRGAALLASLSVLALTGCHHDSSTDSTGQPPLNGTNAVATVNGQDITQTQFYNQLQIYVPNLQSQNAAAPAGSVVLGQMITALLVEQYAKDQGVPPTDAMVDSLYNTFQLTEQDQSVKPFDELLAESGQTAQDLKDWRFRFQLAEVNLLAKGQSPVSDADVSAAYATDKAKTFTLPDRAHIKRLVLSNAADAKRISDQIQKGQTFESFASQSLDHSVPGGDVPVWVNLDVPNAQNQVPPQMIQSIKSAKPGTVVAPFAFHGVYYVVQVVETRPKEVIPFDQVKDAIRFDLMGKKAAQDPTRRQAVSQGLRDFQAKAKISIPEKRYSQLLTQLTSPPAPQASLAPSAPGPAAPAPTP